MLAQCAECNHHFNIGARDVVSGACPDCGAAQSFYRLNPTPVQGEMVPNRDGVIDGKDQGGNPLGEGTIMGNDGERPFGKRDNFMGKVAGGFNFGDGPETTHRFVVTGTGRVHSMPYPAHHEQIADAHGLHYHGFPAGMSMGELRDDGSTDFLTHESGWDPGYLQQALQKHFNQPVTVDPHLQGVTNAQRWQLPPETTEPKRELETLYGPANARSWGVPQDNEGLVRGGSVERHLNMDLYPSLWEKESAAAPAGVEFDKGPDENKPIPHHTALVTPGEFGIHAGTTRWLGFLDAHVNGIPARERASEIMARYGMRNSPEFGKPVSVAVHHLSHLPAAIDTIETSAEGSRASPKMREVGTAIQAGHLPAPPPFNGQVLGPMPLESAGQVQSKVAAFPLAVPAAEVAAPLVEEGLAAAAPEIGAGAEAVGGAVGDALHSGEAIGGQAMNAAEDTANTVGKGIGDGAKGIWNGAKSLFGGGGGDSKATGAVAGPLMKGLKGVYNLHKAEEGAKLLLGDGGDGGGGADVSGGPNDTGPLSGQDPLTMGQLSHVTADYETPGSNPGVGADHDSPEGVDQHEFNDGDNQNNPYNPNLQDSGASGEDNVRQNAGFAPDSPALERMHLMSPLLMHYFHHPEEEGYNDPVVRGLHEALENENPGYQDEVHEGHIHHLREALKFHGRQPHGVVASAERFDFTAGAPPGMDPSAPPPGMDPSAGPPPPPPPPPTGGSGQGPQTDEQIAAVQQYLIKHHRVHEVPNVVLDPNNPEFVKILDKIQNQNQITPPPVDPTQATPPPPQEAPPGAMPVPDPSGGAGGQPMQPMSHVAADNVARRCPRCHSGTTGIASEDGHSFCHACGKTWKDEIIKDDVTARVSADSIARRCPRCQSGTTGLSSSEGDSFCHACGNTWKDNDLLKDTVVSAVTPSHEEHHDINPTTAPAADQQNRLDDADRGKSGEITDASGQPLQEGQEYNMVNPSYTIPDKVKVLKVKPDGILVSIQGVFSNDPSTPQIEDPKPIPISREDIDMQQLSFEPENGDADDMTQEPPSGTPGHAQIPPSGQTTDEAEGSYPTHSSAVYEEIPDTPSEDECHKCGSRSITSSMSSPTRIMYDCYRCAHSWEVDDTFQGKEASNDLDWIMDESGPGGDDFYAEMERARAMRDSGTTSRDIRSIATQDARAQEIKERLDANAQERLERTAGKKFSPSEQRELIEERGLARNSDLLELSDTHYNVRDSYSPSANADRVPDSHLMMGL